jgi:hypothetical protein
LNCSSASFGAEAAAFGDFAGADCARTLTIASKRHSKVPQAASQKFLLFRFISSILAGDVTKRRVARLQETT